MMDRVIIKESKEIPDLDLTGQFFFDTNILVYLQGPFPDPSDWRTRIYSKLMSGILAQGGQIFTDTIVIAEFINLYIKILYKDLVRRRKASADYKEFRQTASFDEIAGAAGADLTGFCRSVEVIDTRIEKKEIARYCKTLRSGTLDFNDLVIIEACRRHSLVVVTHDSDFDSVDVSLVTANRSFSS
jgi:predicted nucleic acid-binding protein